MRSDAVAVDALLERVGEVGGARWPAPIAEADRELRERLLQVLPRAWTDPVTQVRPAIEQVLRDRLPDVNDSDRDWRRTVSGYWDGSVGYAGVEPVDAFLDQVGGYLDDGLPSLTGAAERALRDDLVQVLVEPVPAEATRVLERFLTDAGVTDTIWLEVAVQSWWADVFTSDIVRARALLVQVDQYQWPV